MHVSIVNMYNSIKEPPRGHQMCNTKQIFTFVAYVKVEESLYTKVSIRVNTIPKVDPLMALPNNQSPS